MNGTVVAVCLSGQKGERKRPADSVRLRENHGIVGDAHAGEGERQVSLLAEESIRKMRASGVAAGPGDFAENITTRGMELASLPIGTRLAVGEAVLRVTKIGKECHSRCAIYLAAGDCVMPREGIFAVVLRGGVIRAGDRIAAGDPAQEERSPG
jgi:MOSC domain-containing protein YiiM